MNDRVFNPLLKEFGDRLEANGKKRKQIIVAIMRTDRREIDRNVVTCLEEVSKANQNYSIKSTVFSNHKEPYNPEKRGFIKTQKTMP